jgi:hypothetical protein
VKIYFARCYVEYGTPEDNAIKKAILDKGHELVDPSEFDESEYKRRGMEFHLEKVRQCDELYYKTVGDGRVTAGVAREILEAILHDIKVTQVWWSTTGHFREESWTYLAFEDVMTIDETRDYIEKALKEN